MPRLLLIIFALLISSRIHAHGDDTPQRTSDTVFVQGLVLKPIALTKESLHGFPLTYLGGLKLINSSGEIRKTLANTKGLLLRDILRNAEIDLRNKERGKYFIVVTGMDSMQVIFSYNELIHGPAADQCYLLLLHKTADAADGPFAVYCGSDVHTVPRYVKWVRSIEVRKI